MPTKFVAAILVAQRTTEHLIEAALTTIAAFGSFLVAEHFHVSGVLATVTAGLMMGNLGLLREDARSYLSYKGREFVHGFWEFAAFLANSMVFMIESQAHYIVEALKAAGVKVVSPVREVPGLYKAGMIEDPWGTRIQIVQDRETPGFHHVQLLVADPDATYQWFLTYFGGERTKLNGGLDALKYGAVWLIASKGEGGESKGRAIDHIGFGTTTRRGAGSVAGSGAAFFGPSAAGASEAVSRTEKAARRRTEVGRMG